MSARASLCWYCWCLQSFLAVLWRRNFEYSVGFRVSFRTTDWTRTKGFQNLKGNAIWLSERYRLPISLIFRRFFLSTLCLNSVLLISLAAFNSSNESRFRNDSLTPKLLLLLFFDTLNVAICRNQDVLEIILYVNIKLFKIERMQLACKGLYRVF